MTDETDEPKRGPGRPRKQEDAETADTVLAWIMMERRVTVNSKTNEKAEPGSTVQVPLSEARKLVKRELASWTDPRPDL